MESEDVYYTENSEIIDGDSCWGMQEAVIVENENLNWQEEGPEITVSYSETDDNDQTLTENEMYLSTNPDENVDPDKSQYYSILESTYNSDEGYGENTRGDIIVKLGEHAESILPDMSEDYIVQGEKEHEELSSQVVLYHSDDPNEMYAIQIADDGNGNLQRYKYKVRQNEDGQLEAIPGTIEVQDAADDEVIDKNPAEVSTDEMLSEQEDTDCSKLLITHMEEGDENVKINSIKHEVVDIVEENYDANESYLDEEYGTPEYLLSDDNFEEEDNEYAVMSASEDDLGLQLQNSYHLEMTEEVEDDINREKNKEHVVSNNEIKRKFFKSRTNNSALEVYDDVKNKELTIFKDEKSISYLVVDTKEKENVSVTQIKNFGVKNARSILKSNYIPMEDTKKNLNVKTSIRMLNNKSMITKDAIKPVVRGEEKTPDVKIAAKSVRQPRKQTITPVDRLGSEIIVQPVCYTFNNETPNILIRKKRKYTHRNSQEIVKVSDDSDPDYTDKPKPKKRKNGPKIIKQPKKVAVMVIDSDLSSDDESIIEVLSDKEVESEENDTTKKINDESEDKIEDDKTDDILKIQEVVDSIVQEREERNNRKIVETTAPTVSNNVEKVKKNNIKCPICPKTFPRQINLKNHMNIHSARRVLRSKTNTVAKPDNKTDPKSAISKKPIENNKKLETFYCTKCKLKFLTQLQLTRHLLIHKDKNRITISPRKRQFLQKKSPRKSLEPTKSTISSKSMSTKKINSPYKCEDCNKCFSQRTLLNAHRSIHRSLSCACNKKFTSKILLEDHKKTCTKNPVKKITKIFCRTCRNQFETKEKLLEHEKTAHKKPDISNNSSKVNIRPKRAHGGVPASTRMQKAFDIIKMRS